MPVPREAVGVSRGSFSVHPERRGARDSRHHERPVAAPRTGHRPEGPRAA